MDDGGDLENLLVRNRFLSGSHHVAKRGGQAKHLVVVSVPVIAFDRRRVFEALLLEKDRRVTVLELLVRTAEPNLGGHAVFVRDECVTGVFTSVHADGLNAWS